MAPYYSAPIHTQSQPLLGHYRARSQICPGKWQGPPSDITLLLETANPYDCCVVWPGLSTSPGRLVGGASQGESLALSFCQGKRFHHF